MTIGERIKELRKAKGLTQQKFADQIGLKRNTVGNYEINLIVPSDRTISDICREFNVNETWLRTGEGDMFIVLSREEEIAAFMGKIMRGEDDNYLRRLVHALSKLDVKEWQMLANVAESLVAEELNKKTGPQ